MSTLTDNKQIPVTTSTAQPTMSVSQYLQKYWNNTVGYFSSPKKPVEPPSSLPVKSEGGGRKKTQKRGGYVYGKNVQTSRSKSNTRTKTNTKTKTQSKKSRV
jgi:hypothetical protein